MSAKYDKIVDFAYLLRPLDFAITNIRAHGFDYPIVSATINEHVVFATG